MAKLETMLILTFWVLASLLIVNGNCIAQDIPVREDVNITQLPLENVRIEEETIEQLFSHFSFAYNIPLGLEVAKGDDGPTLYKIDFKTGTLSDLLTQFVKKHEKYAWQIENGVVSVFPKEDYRDPVLREVLVTEINSFSVAPGTSTWTFGKRLLDAPEIKRILKRYEMTYDAPYLGGFYIQQLGQQYSFTVSRMPLKAILDKVAKESPVARNWSISNMPANQKLFLRVNAHSENRSQSSSAPQ